MLYPPKIGRVFCILGGYKNVLCAASVFHYQQIVQPPPQKKINNHLSLLLLKFPLIRSLVCELDW